MFIQVRITTNGERKTVAYSDDTTIRTICEENDIDYATGGTMLDGAYLKAGDYDKTLADFGFTEVCSLSKVVKQDAAAR